MTKPSNYLSLELSKALHEKGVRIESEFRYVRFSMENPEEQDLDWSTNPPTIKKHYSYALVHNAIPTNPLWFSATYFWEHWTEGNSEWNNAEVSHEYIQLEDFTKGLEYIPAPTATEIGHWLKADDRPHHGAFIWWYMWYRPDLKMTMETPGVWAAFILSLLDKGIIKPITA